MRYTVKAAAIATGVSESSLRTWERRYGIPHPPRSDTGRRLYNEDDLEVVRRMAALVSRGVPASEAAAVAAAEGSTHPAEVPSQVDEHPLVRQLLAAAGSYNENAIVHAIDEAAAAMGIGAALDLAIMPGLRRIGQAWGDQTLESGNEHFTSEVVRRELSRRIAFAPSPPDGQPSIVLACAEGERHDLGLLGLSLLLRERGIRVMYLGADVPIVDLERATKKMQPDAVCVAAVLPGSVATTARALRALATGRKQPKLFAGGPALMSSQAEWGIPAVRLPQSLLEASNVIVDSLVAR